MPRLAARLARHSFTALAALSLLLCVAACVLWERSTRIDQRYFASYVLNRSLRFEAAGGLFHIRCREALGPPGPSGRPFRYGQWNGPYNGIAPSTDLFRNRRQWRSFTYVSQDWPTEEKTLKTLRQVQLILDERQVQLSEQRSRSKAQTPEERRLAREADLLTSWANRQMLETGASRELMFPAWSAALVFAAAPAVWTTALLRRRLRRRKASLYGHCPACGYDLRASPGRCPECGADGPRVGHSAGRIA
jgi:hypothetical protein